MGQDISLLFSDQHLLAVNKPYDLLTVPGRGPDKQDCLINRLLRDYPNARIVHRLDYATSGIVLIPLSHESQKQLGWQFEKRTMSKSYIAQVYGLLKEDSGRVDLPLICDWPNRPKQMVDHQQGKPAQTDYQVLERDTERNTTRVKLTPITGRSHQLRVHMQALGHPICGDFFYAQGPSLEAADRLLLHAARLAFKHPISGETIELVSEPDF